MIVGVIGLMLASFFAGFSFRNLPMFAAQFAQTPIVLTIPSNPGSFPTGSPTGPFTAPTPIKVSNMTIDGAIVKGKPNATVTFVDFSDFQCPFCQRYSNTTYHQLMDEYVDTGKIQYAFVQFPLEFHANAKPAAIAAQCANDQEMFWPFHDRLYSTQDKWQSLSGNETSKIFKKYAIDLKMDPKKFDSCYDSQKYKDKIEKDIQKGSKYQVSGTPTFYIGNNKSGFTQIVGAQPMSTFKQTIDQLLKS